MGDFEDLRGAAEGASTFREEMRRVRAEMRASSEQARSLSSTLGGSLRGAFDRLMFGGAQASDVLRQLGRDLAGRVFDSAVRPVQGAVADGIGGALTKGLGGLLGGMSLFADGGAFSAGRVRAFAGGGVVEGPTMFPMRGGTGLMGEAGPEAILPLRRGADGRLGVAAAGGGGGARVTVNITTQDAESFRRSRAQVAAQIARAVRAGQRHQ
ncbi:phage tail tape measure protein [Oceanicella actignis]|uniref:Phage tail tape measure protein, lambda family n=1 Tax=Oceanicella actignis TaxID=1189325 RepID=A0A1M7TZQ6_9RHOB|nr:phage tail tape measure protein [Oceanicella actignis]TYO85044.1 lambda family phage tail tape measure protein [Oceanicella actignis]SET83621.1 phage tail tape measure protein, lambda family [Oceanicella actignis]SHN76236.1 phage tail tape measure protein, lambda family [Oceanicella actignis]